MPYAYTSWWGIDDGSCEMEACMKLTCQPGLRIVSEEREYDKDGRVRIKVTYQETEK